MGWEISPVPGYVSAAAVAVVAALFLTPMVALVARRIGALDHPIDRSVHQRPIPHLGGVAIFFAIAVTAVYHVGWQNELFQGLMLGGLLILIVGIYDDFYGISPLAKLGGQIAAAAVLIFFGVRIEWITHPFGGGLLVLDELFLPLSIPLTILWVVAVTNMLNLIDGLDGLAAGIAAIAAFFMLFSGVQIDTLQAAIVLTAVLMGSCLGFLPFNFNPARIFMGDGGSMFLGFGLSAIAIEGLIKGPALVALAVPVLVLGLPIFDLLLAMARRWRSGVSVFRADKAHLHHRLLRLGLSHRQTVLAMYVISGWLGISAIAVTGMTLPQAIFVFLFVCVSFYYGARTLGILDFSEIGEIGEIESGLSAGVDEQKRGSANE